MTKKTKRKAPPRRSAAPVRSPQIDILGLADACDSQIRFAEGIDFAIAGAARLGYAVQGIVELMDHHLTGLRAVRAMIEGAREIK